MRVIIRSNNLVLPGQKTFGSSDIELVFNSYPNHLEEGEMYIFKGDDFLSLAIDIHNIHDMGIRPRIVVVLEKYQFMIVNSVFPELELVDVSEPYTLGGILNGRDTFSFNNREVVLKKKELEMLKYLSFGLNQNELCIKMDVSLRTIKRMKQRLLDKTGLCSTQQLTVYALSRNIGGRMQ